MQQPVDVLILSNGPGELSTWVQPVVRELRRQLGEDREQVRISVVIAPCSNASGQEVAIARRYPEVDRIQAAAHFFPFLLWGKTYDLWDWRKHGVVVFLGGDQFFAVVIGKRLGYRTVVYAEWEARWHRWVDRFGVMQSAIAERAAPRYASKFTVVGDLMAEAGRNPERAETAPSPSQPSTVTIPPAPLIGLLPGSKPMKLILGVPLTLAIAERVHQALPEVRFVIPVAPTLDLVGLAAYADPAQNPLIEKFGWTAGELIMPHDADQLPCLTTPSGLQVSLWSDFPAHDLLVYCTLCLTTIGANTAELGALAVPMIVLIPTQQLDIMRAWDGLPGLLVNLPGVGAGLATVINAIARSRAGLMAWPNLWAKREIVPELLGDLEPDDIAARVIHFLNNPADLDTMRRDLQSVRGKPGAAEQLVTLVRQELEGVNAKDQG